MADSIINFLDNDFPVNLESGLKTQIRRNYELISKNLSEEIYHIKRSKENKEPISFMPLDQLVEAQAEISKFQRSLLLKFHKENVFSDETLKSIENELDIEDLRLNTLLQRVTGSSQK